MRGKTRPAVIRVSGETLMVMTMRWPDEVRAPELDIPEVVVGMQEIELARHLITAMTGTFDADDLVDVRRQRLLSLVESAPVIPHQRTTGEPSATVHDLMAALQASVARHSTEGEAVEPTPIRRSKKKTA
jgi:DNA end-binding protein Ku